MRVAHRHHREQPFALRSLDFRNTPTKKEDHHAQISPDITDEIRDEGLPSASDESGDRPPLGRPPPRLVRLRRRRC